MRACSCYTMPHNIGWLRSTVGGTPVWLANCPCLRSACSRRVTTMWVNRLLQVSKLGNSAFHPSRVDKRVAGLFIGCVLRWHHLVNTCKVKVDLIGCWQNLGTSGLTWLLLLSCMTVCVSCHCCPAWQTAVCCRQCVRLSGLS